MIASEKRHNTNLLDASVSSYATQERRFIIKLNHPQKKKAEDDDELGIFGAEKYFTGAIDDEQLNKTPFYQNSNKNDHQPSSIAKPKPKPETQSGTPSVRSESSWNSRRGLLVNNGNDQRKKSGVKSLLASLGCNCNDKASVKVTNNNKVRVNEAAKPPVNSAQKTKSVSSRWAEEDVPKNKCEFNGLNTKRDDCFTFPVLKHPEPPEGDKQVYSERKLTMLNWDNNKDNIINDAGSDASSDLFEIESFSTNENNSFLARQTLETSEGRLSNANGYAPSEVSVDWSVVTACAEDLTVCKNAQAKEDRGSGNILSGCHSLKAVRVSGDEYCVTRGAEDPARREWCRGRLDSVTPIAKIQAESKLVGVGCDLKRGQNGFGTARFVPRTHYLNI